MTQQGTWRHVHLDDIVDLHAPICYGIVLPGEHCDSGVPVVKVKDIVQGSVQPEGLLRTATEIEAKYTRSRLAEGDILLSIRGTVGRVGKVPKELAGANITQDTARIRISRVELREYVFHVLQSDALQDQIRDLVVGQAVKGINIRDVRRLRLTLPVDPRQQKRVGDLLSLQDQAIRSNENLLVAKQVHLNHRRDQILEHPASDSRTKLQKVTQELTKRNTVALGRDAIMAVTKDVGMRPMREESIASNIERYKVVPPHAFAYNPMRLNIGSIAISPFDYDVLVSPDYVVFACDESKLLPAYLNHLRHTRHWRSHFEQAGNGSVRIRIYYDDLAAFSLPLPPVELQERIVTTFDAATREISLLREQADALRKQKRGLMQRLLTGEWRLPLAKEEAV